MYQPKLYAELNSQTRTDGLYHLNKIKHILKWNKNERILDIGCGPGDFTAEILASFAPPDAFIVGCDMSQKMIDYANSVFKSSRIEFKVMDIESTNIWENDAWTKESFTKIYSLYCLQWVDKYREAAQNMYSLLKPGGEIYLLFLAENKIFKVLTDMRNSEPWKRYMKGRIYFERFRNGTIDDRKRQFTEELENAGFRDIEVKLEDREHLYPSMESYTKMMKSVDPYRTYVPEELRKEYDDCFQDKLSKISSIQPQNDKAKINYTLFIVQARKSL